MLYLSLIVVFLFLCLLVHLAHRRTVKFEDAEVRFFGLFVVKAKRFESKRDQ